jgi:hypothetical protein
MHPLASSYALAIRLNRVEQLMSPTPLPPPTDLQVLFGKHGCNPNLGA